MATYDSIHTGTAVDQAVERTLANKSKGDSSTPIYLDANGEAIAITKSIAPAEDDEKLITSGTMYTELGNKYNRADIATSTDLGTSTVLIPSEGAIKTYTDNAFSGKQDKFVAGDGITVDGSTVSLGDTSGFMSSDELSGKRQHFSEELTVGDEADVVAKMNEAKHSTFDLSKFTVVGSPVITSDGIASGFNNSNQIKSTYTIGNILGKSWDAYFEIILPNVETSNRITFGSAAIDQNGGFQIDYNPNGNLLIKPYVKTGNSSDSQSKYMGDILLKTSDTTIPNNKLWIKFSYDLSTGTYTVSSKWFESASWTLGRSYVATTTVKDLIQATTSPTAPFIQFGNGATSANAIYLSSNLKSFKITVDGVPVFSGNKTGIDTIKADDYTVVGSPTITSDGILNLSNIADYFIKIPAPNLSTANTWKIESEFIFTSGILSIISGVNSSHALLFCGVINNKIEISIGDNLGGSSWAVIKDGTTTVTTGTKHHVDIIYTGTNYNVYLDGNLEITLERNEKLSYASDYTINIGANRANSVTGSGSIDLNSFKIYVDGNLVYQPCLKIPYTQTKDGKKIVDYNYKSRVEDEYGQAGFTPYYTFLGNDISNFTVKGSPTISNWVASGFSSTNKIYRGTAFSTAGCSTFDIVGKFKINSIPSSTSNDVFSTGAINKARLTISPLARLEYIFNGDTNIPSATNVVQANVDYNFKVSVDLVNRNIKVFKSSDGITFTKVIDSTYSSNKSAAFNSSIIFGNQSAYDRPFNGDIDLKEFKIYTDGQLAYEAVTPAQYTMSTIKPSELVDSKINGASIYRQYANQTIEQYGTCTSGTAVTFEKPFIDTNYALSVPYSVKTKTGFTPTQTGSWKAKGKVSI